MDFDKVFSIAKDNGYHSSLDVSPYGTKIHIMKGGVCLASYKISGNHLKLVDGSDRLPLFLFDTNDIEEVFKTLGS